MQLVSMDGNVQRNVVIASIKSVVAATSAVN